MDLENFKDLVRESRPNYIIPPRNLVYESFIMLGFDKKEEDYFFSNSSHIIEKLRKLTWERFQSDEKEF